MEKQNLLDVAEEVFVGASTLAINILLPIIGPIIKSFVMSIQGEQIHFFMLIA